MAHLPTRRLDVVNGAHAVDEIHAFAKQLEAAGERAWFEVHYPKPADMTDEEFARRDAETFDAVEVIDGDIRTLPPYSELTAAAEAH